MNYIGSIALITLLVPPSPQAQPAHPIQLTEDRLVHIDPNGLPLVEPHLSIDPEARRMVAGATSLRFPAGGEYMGLAAAPDGTFHLLWADSRDGVYQLRRASAKVSATVAPSK